MPDTRREVTSIWRILPREEGGLDEWTPSVQQVDRGRGNFVNRIVVSKALSNFFSLHILFSGENLNFEFTTPTLELR